MCCLKTLVELEFLKQKRNKIKWGHIIDRIFVVLYFVLFVFTYIMAPELERSIIAIMVFVLFWASVLIISVCDDKRKYRKDQQFMKEFGPKCQNPSCPNHYIPRKKRDRKGIDYFNGMVYTIKGGESDDKEILLCPTCRDAIELYGTTFNLFKFETVDEDDGEETVH